MKFIGSFILQVSKYGGVTFRGLTDIDYQGGNDVPLSTLSCISLFDFTLIILGFISNNDLPERMFKMVLEAAIVSSMLLRI